MVNIKLLILALYLIIYKQKYDLIILDQVII